MNKFTFHYVSIKSELGHRGVGGSRKFTFHYVSIKSGTQHKIFSRSPHLHSTMYLLNHKLLALPATLFLYLHSTMYLLNQPKQHPDSQTELIYIPLCIY